MLHGEGDNNQWYALDVDDVLREVGVGPAGLSSAEALVRGKRTGPNILPDPRPDSLPLIFARQFANPLVYILVVASLAVLFLGDVVDASIIAFVLVFNAVAGTVQEGRAQRTLLALRSFVSSDAIVIRDGREAIIPDAEVVPGDILMLREGERVAADARLISVEGLTVTEAAFTGESSPVQKSLTTVPAGTPVADRTDMVFKGTTIVSGQARAVVVATGLNTVVGGIAREVSAIDTEVPLRREIRSLSRLVAITVIVGSALLILFGVLQGRSPSVMLATAVSLAVSVVPEGLPIVMTLVLATGVWRMSKRHALVKRLQAVQALGNTDIIAVDKTGTLTRNELIVRRVRIGERQIDVAGQGYEPVGELTERGVQAERDDALALVARIAAQTASAHIAKDEKSGAFRIFGDPTEAALEVFARKAGSTFQYGDNRTDEIPFNSARRYRAVLHPDGEGHLLMVAGAPDTLLPLCSGDTGWAHDAFQSWASEGQRVLVFAYARQKSNSLNPDKLPKLTVAAVVGMEDDLRAEVPEAVRQARAAGVEVVMITGDHLLAARAIAADAGIATPKDRMLTGERIAQLSDGDLPAAVEGVRVFARVSPDQKLRIIKAWRSKGLIVAMTGDGVNDAPSLVAADLGVAMGRIGTEVAKEAADIVLLDDNLSSIVAAIEEGRSIYKTIKKVILYLFGTSIGEALTIVGAMAFGWPLPLLAGQIIWLNLVTDGFQDVALAMDPKEPHLLRPEYKTSEHRRLVDRLMVQRMIVMAVPMAVGCLWIFSHYLSNGDALHGTTVVLTTLAAFQWFNAFNCRFNVRSVFRMNWLENPYLLAATAAVIGLQLMAVYAPFMQRILRTQPLTLMEWGIALSVATSIIAVEELRKAYMRSRRA